MKQLTDKTTILITCPKAMSPYLAREAAVLGYPVQREMTAGVEVRGNILDCMMLNLHVRTGHRVLYELASFRASGPDELYREVKRIPWEEYIPLDGYFSVSSSIRTDAVNDSRFASLKCKDAVADRFMEEEGRRPDSGPGTHGAVLFLYWQDDRVTLYFDTSGEPLSRRGYRKIPCKAPMQETLAAAVLMAAEWDGSGHFVNPMCGSGTLAIEAAWMAINRAPGILREHFSFMTLLGFDERAWNVMRNKAMKAEKRDFRHRIVCTDIDPTVVEGAKKNAAAAKVAGMMEFDVCDFAETRVPSGKGTVMLNPEYGQRLGDVKKLEGTYKGIGDFFKQRCKGYKGYVFTGNLNLAKKLGLRASRRTVFYNSKIECRLLEYEMYEGSRKNKA